MSTLFIYCHIICNQIPADTLSEIMCTWSQDANIIYQNSHLLIRFCWPFCYIYIRIFIHQWHNQFSRNSLEIASNSNLDFFFIKFLNNDRENRDICEISLQRYYIMLSSKWWWWRLIDSVQRHLYDQHFATMLALKLNFKSLKLLHATTDLSDEQRNIKPD